MNFITEKATTKDTKTILKLMEKQAIDERKFISFNKKSKFSFYSLEDIKKEINSKNSIVILTRINNKVVGCGLARIEEAPSWSKYKKYGYLGMLYVDKKYRGLGIAKNLRFERIKWLKSKGIKLLGCIILSNNVPALTLVQKEGFRANSVWMFKEVI